MKSNHQSRKQIRTVLQKRHSSHSSQTHSYSCSHSPPPPTPTPHATPSRPSIAAPASTHSSSHQRASLPPFSPGERSSTPLPLRPTTASPQSRRISSFQRPQTAYMYVERPKTSLGFKPKSRPGTPGGEESGKKKRFGSVRRFFKEL